MAVRGPIRGRGAVRTICPVDVGRAVQWNLDHLGVVDRLGSAVLAGAHGGVF